MANKQASSTVSVVEDNPLAGSQSTEKGVLSRSRGTSENVTYITNNLPQLLDLCTPSSTLTEFTLFPTLPYDLRIYIWSFLPFESRLIVVTNPSRVKRLISTPPPAILSVHKESRMLGLKSYELLNWASESILINWKLDMIIFEQRLGFETFDTTFNYIKQRTEEIPGLLEKCQALAYCVDEQPESPGDSFKGFTGFKTLRRFVLYSEVQASLPWANPRQLAFGEYSDGLKDGYWYWYMETSLRGLEASPDNTIKDATVWLLMSKAMVRSERVHLGNGFYGYRK